MQINRCLRYYISEFIQIKFPGIFKEFLSFPKTKYNYIFAPLLEHLQEPIKLVEQIYQSLEPGGIPCLTTAKNIPV